MTIVSILRINEDVTLDDIVTLMKDEPGFFWKDTARYSNILDFGEKYGSFIKYPIARDRVGDCFEKFFGVFGSNPIPDNFIDSYREGHCLLAIDLPDIRAVELALLYGTDNLIFE